MKKVIYKICWLRKRENFNLVNQNNKKILKEYHRKTNKIKKKSIKF